jgi:tetratricopeptide (TPR) repeat protein
MSLDFLDSDDWEPASGDHPTWSMDEIGNHPLFMDSLPEDSSNSHIEALQAVLYDEETPYGLCSNFKNQGNEAMARGFMEDAIVFYNRALDSGCEDPTLLSQIHSNLALVYLKKTEYPKCTDECFRAIGLDPTNLKAYYRGGVASLKLDLLSQATYFVKGGLDVDETHVDLQTLQSEIEQAKSVVAAAREESKNSSQSTQQKPKYRWRS